MKSHIIILFFITSAIISCKNKNSLEDIEIKYYALLEKKGQDFYSDKKLQKNISDNSNLYKRLKPKDSFDFSNWKSIKYKTGDLVTKSKKRAKIYDYNNKNTLSVFNSEKFDAIISIFRGTNNNSNRCITYGYYYLKSGKTLHINNITGGNYHLSAKLGLNWMEFKEKIKSYTEEDGKKRIKHVSTRNYGEFSKNKHIFNTDSLSFTNNTNLKVIIKNSKPLIHYPKSLGKLIYEDETGKELSQKEVNTIILKKDPSSTAFQNIIIDGVLECIIVNTKQ